MVFTNRSHSKSMFCLHTKSSIRSPFDALYQTFWSRRYGVRIRYARSLYSTRADGFLWKLLRDNISELLSVS